MDDDLDDENDIVEAHVQLCKTRLLISSIQFKQQRAQQAEVWDLLMFSFVFAFFVFAFFCICLYFFNAFVCLFFLYVFAYNFVNQHQHQPIEATASTFDAIVLGDEKCLLFLLNFARVTTSLA